MYIVNIYLILDNWRHERRVPEAERYEAILTGTVENWDQPAWGRMYLGGVLHSTCVVSQDAKSDSIMKRIFPSVRRIVAVGVFFSGVGLLLLTQPAQAASEAMPILEQTIQTVLAENAHQSSDPVILVRLADLYLDLGDEQTDATERRTAYEKGAGFARQALAIQERNAQAHYLYAANLGSAAQLKGVMASALTIAELKIHVRRALELQPDYPQALHMMGMMLEELPWFLGGDAAAALTYLQRAIVTDPSYVHARLDLARAYIKRQTLDAARRELGSILDRPSSSVSSDSDRRYREEAATLLSSLPGR